MALRSPQQYRQSLRDGRTVYYKGQRVEDVTEHSELRLAVKHASIDYEMAESPEYRDLAVYQEDGESFSRYYKIPRSSDDLLLRSRLIETATALGGTLVVLIKEIGTDGLFALHLVAHEMDQRLGTQYLDRVQRFYHYARENDFGVSVAQTDVKGDRSLGPREQEHPDYYVHIVDETPEGIIVRGAKVHTSVSINTNEVIVLPTRNMSEADRDYAVAFALPLNTKGLKLITSAYGAHHDDRPFDFPLASQHRMVETLTVFDDVLVPHDRVFLKGEWPFAGELAKTFVEFHRFTAISYKLPLVDALVGAALLMVEYNGIERAKHVQEKLSRLISYAETLRALVRLAAIDCHSGPLGIAIPNTLLVNMAKLHFATNYHQALAYVQDITGGLIVTGPGEADLANPETGPLIERYLGGRRGVSATNRLKAINLVKELTATDFAGYQAVLAIHAEGSIEAEKLAMVREHDSARCKTYVKRLAGIED
ncbi:MAG: gamma-aminobutyrate dehydratase [Acidobacteria bacterium]|nr:gamma-aminobutyrate dehydratase [Acidobacteriota bacterium]